jgi:ribosomal protein L37AE/L43A
MSSRIKSGVIFSKSANIFSTDGIVMTRYCSFNASFADIRLMSLSSTTKIVFCTSGSFRPRLAASLAHSAAKSLSYHQEKHNRAGCAANKLRRIAAPHHQQRMSLGCLFCPNCIFVKIGGMRKIYKHSFFALPDSRLVRLASDNPTDPEKVKACGRHIQG